MNILFLYFNYDLRNSLLPIYFSKTFKDLGHKVTTAGRSGENAPPIDFEFKSPLVSLGEILEKTGNNFDMIFFFHPTPHFWITDIEKSQVPTVLYAIDTFIPFVKGLMEGYASLFDYIFCSQIDYVEKLKKTGLKNIWWSPYACYPKIHKNHHLKKTYKMVFLGGHNALHNPRRAFYLKMVSKIFGLKIMNNKYFDDLAKVYSRTKIVFNIPTMYDLNPRVFETLACGTLVITPKNQAGRNLLLKEKIHLVTFSNFFDALRKIKYYLDHEDERKKIAKAGCLEVLKNHTYEKRFKEILSKIKGKTEKKFSQKQYLKIAKSHYIVGDLKTTFYWLKKAQSQKNSPLKKFQLALLSKAVNLGGKSLQRKIFVLYSRQAALKALMWQFKNF